ncbi:MAG: ABC transporter ATP-binding protein [Rubellimicrobium sp.]|nr:ABC transporter ATP-binding protein [Rubellimicrobium sp.]
MTNPVLEIQNLITEFPTRNGVFRAVDDVSLTVEAGRTLCVVGESGSGKSVTARSVLQIVDHPGRITQGRILLHRHNTARRQGDEDDIVDLAALPARGPEIRAIRGRDVAMIFQEPMSALSPVHTIGNQIVEAIRLHEAISKKDAMDRAVELLRLVEIPTPEKAIKRYTFEYSGGMRQRAMIAMAIACNPSVLIADEPTTALDVTIQAEIIDLLRRLQQETGMGMMFITHDMGVVAEIADEVAVMYRGQVVERGAPLPIFEAPKEEYTQRLLAAVKRLDEPSPRRLAMRAASPPGATALKVDRLAKHFYLSAGLLGLRKETFVAVNDASLELREGENLGIVGESGSGKTTLGRCIQGVHGTTRGAIRFTGRDGRTTDLAKLKENELRPAWREIRMVFQDPFSSLNPRMTVGQIIGEPLLLLRTHSKHSLRQRVCELLDVVGLPQSAYDRYPHAFSGGQRQRIGIARAIAPEPRVIIADEATSALDVSLRIQILDLLLDLQERMGLSFLLISHDIAVIRYFCDRIAVMHRGKIVETGETEAVCSNPTHPYTRSLLSAVPVPDPRQRGKHVRTRYRADAESAA